jgi:hypothetical protein
MSLENLFMKEVSDKGELALTQLPKDMDQWPETIVSKIKEKLPQSKHLLMKVTFMQKNEEQGTSTGCVTLHDQKLNKSLYIPLITKNFKLYPLDVMIIPKKDSENGLEVVPLTPDGFDECMFNSDVFSHLERPMDRIQQLYLNPQNSVVYPPYFRNVYASAQVIDAINDTISPEDRAKFVQDLKANPEVLVGYEKRANLDVLKKIAGDQKASMKNKVQKPVQIGNSNIAFIKKDVKGDFKICYTSDEVFDPIIQNVGKHEIHDHVSAVAENAEEILNEVERNGEYIVVDNTKPAEGASVKDMEKIRYQDVDDDPVDVKRFGSYRVMDKGGTQHKGLVFPTVINFDQNVTGTKLFYKGDKTCYQTKIVGIPTEAEPSQFLRFREPSIGMTGVFVAMNEKNAICTIPITLRSVMEDSHGYSYQKLVGETLEGKKIKIKYSHGGLESTEQHLKHDFEEPGDLGLKEIVKTKDFYIVPKRFRFLPLSGSFCELHENPGSMYMKTASMSLDASPVKIIHTGANQFSLKGPDMHKMASAMGWDKTNLSAGQAIFLLTAKKAPIEKTAYALKSAGKWGSSEIHHLPNIIDADQYKSSITKQASYFDNYIKGLKVNLIKEASKLEETQLVDTALSLNFINSKNVDKFVSFIPYFKECTKMLAQSLLAARLGMTEIPEQDTQTAMYKLVDVVKGLERLKQHQNG